MTNAGHQVVPVDPTVSAWDLVNRGSTSWSSRFPFVSPKGIWTFSGRVALYLGLPVLNLPRDSTILVPSYFQGVEIQTLLTAGYNLSFYRLNNDFTINLNDAGKLLHKDVSALYITHYFGFPQPLTPILRFCKDYNLKLIEDCALSLFSEDEHGPLGSQGDLALYSVYKTLPLPHGGFLVTKSKKATGVLKPAPLMSTFVQLRDLMHQHLKSTGWSSVEKWFSQIGGIVRKGIDWDREDTISSGITHWDERLLKFGASAVVMRLMSKTDPERVIRKRRENFLQLKSRLTGKIDFPLSELPAKTCPLFFPVVVVDKEKAQNQLATRGIGTVNLWSEDHPACPQHLASEVRPWRQHILELPIHQGLNSDDIDRVADNVIALRLAGDL